MIRYIFIKSLIKLLLFATINKLAKGSGLNNISSWTIIIIFNCKINYSSPHAGNPYYISSNVRIFINCQMFHDIQKIIQSSNDEVYQHRFNSLREKD